MSTQLKNIVDQSLLNQMIQDKYIRVGTHPRFNDLRIYNYTQNAQFDQKWNDATNICRGLITRIVNGDELVWARPFKKFHNINTYGIPETMFENLPTDEVPVISDKLDGSMGVVYEYDGLYYVATRGSFSSDQAIWATKWLQKHIQTLKDTTLLGFLFDKTSSMTLVTEILYPENRIVVDYNGYEGLRPIGLIKNDTGVELSRRELEDISLVNKLEVVDQFKKPLTACLRENSRNAEGYVLTYSNGLKLKVKFEEYCRIHRMVTGLNPRSVWEKLALDQQQELHGMLADNSLGQSFRTWLDNWMKQLLSDYQKIEVEAIDIFNTRPKVGRFAPYKDTRKIFAQHFTLPENKHLSGILFKLLDNLDYSGLIWKMIKPAHNDTFRKDGEE